MYFERNLDQLYDLLKVQDAPEVHVWALWTLVKLTQSDSKIFCSKFFAYLATCVMYASLFVDFANRKFSGDDNSRKT